MLCLLAAILSVAVDGDPQDWIVRHRAQSILEQEGRRASPTRSAKAQPPAGLTARFVGGGEWPSGRATHFADSGGFGSSPRSPSLIACLNPRIAWPMPRATSGSLRGPKMSKAMPRITSSSGTPKLPIRAL